MSRGKTESRWTVVRSRVSSVITNYCHKKDRIFSISFDILKTDSETTVKKNSTMAGSSTEDFFGQLSFGWMDYSLFIFLLCVSIAIGVYFGFFSKQDNTTEYLLGGKTMGYFPIAMSLLARSVNIFFDKIIRTDPSFVTTVPIWAIFTITFFQ